MESLCRKPQKKAGTVAGRSLAPIAIPSTTVRTGYIGWCKMSSIHGKVCLKAQQRQANNVSLFFMRFNVKVAGKLVSWFVEPPQRSLGS